MKGLTELGRHFNGKLPSQPIDMKRSVSAALTFVKSARGIQSLEIARNNGDYVAGKVLDIKINLLGAQAYSACTGCTRASDPPTVLDFSDRVTSHENAD